MRSRKRMLSLLLAVLLVIASVVNVFADNHTIDTNLHQIDMDSVEMNSDVAQTVALLFVLGSKDFNQWDNSLTVSEVIPLYNHQRITAYCILFEINNQNCGYVVISANDVGPIILEYSDTLPPSFYEEYTSISSISTVYVEYAGPLNYIIDMHDSDDPSINDSIGSSSVARNSKLGELIVYVNQVGTVSTNTDYLGNPLEWLASLYGSSSVTYIGSGNVSNNVLAYYINETNACSVYGTAAILQYYCGYSFSSIIDTCLYIARNYGYATYSNGSWDYYMQLGSLQNFVNDCISCYGLSKTATSVLLNSWSVGVSEISNNRPFLYNIAYGLEYQDHTVTAYGYEWYYISVLSDYMRFFKVRDGYTSNNNTNRYVTVDYVTGDFVTKITP